MSSSGAEATAPAAAKGAGRAVLYAGIALGVALLVVLIYVARKGGGGYGGGFTVADVTEPGGVAEIGGLGRLGSCGGAGCMTGCACGGSCGGTCSTFGGAFVPGARAPCGGSVHRGACAGAPGGPCVGAPNKRSGEHTCPPFSCQPCMPPERIHPVTRECSVPDGEPLPPRGGCDFCKSGSCRGTMPPYHRKGSGPHTCPRDLCGSWCWDQRAVEEAQGLASAGAGGFGRSAADPVGAVAAAVGPY